MKTRVKLIKQLTKQSVNILDGEDVKKAIAIKKCSEGHKQGITQAYVSFTKMLNIEWDAPRYIHVKTLPFIPIEAELVALISGCSKKISVSLQLLKETGMRIGETWLLKWTDLDTERNILRCTSEKHGNPRQFKISKKLISMLQSLPTLNEYIFGNTSLKNQRWRYNKQRKKLATKLQNPRLSQIKFHTFRHWKATMEYNRTKDILYVKQLLGHRNINSTMLYIQLVNFESDEYHFATAKNLQEDQKLIEAGFEYITEREDLKLYRKRK